MSVVVFFRIRRGSSRPTFERAVAGIHGDAGAADRTSHQVPHPPASTSSDSFHQANGSFHLSFYRPMSTVTL